MTTDRWDYLANAAIAFGAGLGVLFHNYPIAVFLGLMSLILAIKWK